LSSHATQKENWKNEKEKEKSHKGKKKEVVTRTIKG